MSSGKARDRYVIVGGVAGGATAAARIHRHNIDAKITVIERTGDVSFANCGMPYFIGREIADQQKLQLHTPASLSAATGAHVLANTEAVSIDRTSKTVSVRSVINNTTNKPTVTTAIPYDKLILAPGATPFLPPIPGVDLPGVHTLWSMVDMRALDTRLQRSKSVVIVGGGFVGLELCEQLVRLGKRVILLEALPHVMPPVDEDLVPLVEAALREARIVVHTRAQVTKIERSTSAAEASNGSLLVTLNGESLPIEADAVIMCAGIRPRSELAKAAGLALGPRGHIKVNPFMQTSDPCIYACGDVVESFDQVFPELSATIPLANVANQQARIAADHAATGRSEKYLGSLGTGIVRCFELVVAVTGWNARRLAGAKIPFLTTTVVGYDHAGYYPGATTMLIRIHHSPIDGRLLGAQVIGEHGVDKRIDVLATCIAGRMTIEQLSMLQLAYAPPFGSARDVVNTAGLLARNASSGFVNTVTNPQYLSKDTIVLDCRRVEQRSVKPLPIAKHCIVYGNVVNDTAKLDKNADYVTICQWGRLSYFTALAMKQLGFQHVRSLEGGVAVHFPQYDMDAQRIVKSRL